MSFCLFVCFIHLLLSAFYPTYELNHMFLNFLCLTFCLAYCSQDLFMLSKMAVFHLFLWLSMFHCMYEPQLLYQSSIEEGPIFCFALFSHFDGEHHLVNPEKGFKKSNFSSSCMYENVCVCFFFPPYSRFHNSRSGHNSGLEISELGRLCCIKF
uniref:Uncharacterized protein n=1 Tax=Rousettus aegyptiacus TaxID=9407 RepID=A0A7J8H1E9_ROUAE|nr:hypothetical protein HJG63_011294 [Rousettus aegyptiacus]